MEIKFRVWNKISKEYTYFGTPVLSLDKKELCPLNFLRPANRDSTKVMLSGYGELEQFFSTDKKGVEIYAGSIIDMPYQWYMSNGREREITEEGFYRGEVVLWPSCGLRIKNPIRHTNEGEKIKHKSHVGISASISEVVGNIHETPELLK